MAMNRFVRLEDLLVRQGVLAIVLLLPCLLPSVVLGQQQKTPDQTVPDAPTPQGPDNLGNITSGMTPGKGAQAPQDQNTNPDQPPPATGNLPAGQNQVQETPPIVPPSGELQKDLATFRTNVNYVLVPVTVLDKKHNQVAGLTWRDFEVYENNVRQRIAFFSPGDLVPLSVALVIDQSLPRDTMKKVNDSLAAIQGGFTPFDEIAVFTYADGVNNPTDFTAALSARLPAVLEQSKKPGADLGAPITGGPLASGPTINGKSVDPNLDPQRGNAGFLVYPKEIHTLNDAILAAGKSLSTRPLGSRRIIYVISDGKESRSKANYREVVRYLEANQVAVYGTLVGDSATWGVGYLDKFKIPLLPLSPDNILPRYAADTGGHLYSEFSTNGIERSFAELAVLARTQYTIGYYSKVSVTDSRYRVLDVRVKRPNLDVIAKKGYYPTATNLSR
jgi:VWFA-related protein